MGQMRFAFSFSFPVWETRGGGLVTRSDDRAGYYFVELPAVFGFRLGDQMPVEWDIVPVNELACRHEKSQPKTSQIEWSLVEEIEIFPCVDV